MDKTNQILLSALKTALTKPGSHALFKLGKQPGLFGSRTGTSGEAAQRATQDGLLEVVRRESNGKGQIEWVRVTSRGVQFVYDHESPKEVLEELVAVLRPARNGLPAWIEEVHSQFQVLANRFSDLLEKQCHYLDHLVNRAECALGRLTDVSGATNGNGRAENVDWRREVLDYLHRRQMAAGLAECPLAELFSFSRNEHPGLSIASFHEGLAALVTQGAVKLLPFQGQLAELSEPEYAMLEGAIVYHAVCLRV